MYTFTHKQVDARLYVDVMLSGRKIWFKTSSNVLGVRDVDGEWAMGEHYNLLDPHELVKEGARFYCQVEGVSRWGGVGWLGESACVGGWVGGLGSG